MLRNSNHPSVNVHKQNDKMPLCPRIDTNGSWITGDRYFSWRSYATTPSSPSSAPYYKNTPLEFTLPKRGKSPVPNIQKRWDSQHRNRTIVFYGSSHLRELYFALIRLHRGLRWDAPLEQVVKQVGSGNPDIDGNRTKCDPDRRQFLGGYGVDLEHCGMPTFRLVPELEEKLELELQSKFGNKPENVFVIPQKSSQVGIGFHTYIHTPDADEAFLSFLEKHQIRHPDILILDIGIWGTRGNILGGCAKKYLTPEEEINYFLQWVQTHFQSAHIVWIFEPPNHFNTSEPPLGPLIQTKLAELDPDTNIIVRKDLLLHNKPKKMPCGHGCAGPLVHILALLIHDWLERPYSECLSLN